MNAKEYSYLMRSRLGGDDPHGIRLLVRKNEIFNIRFKNGRHCEDRMEDYKMRHPESRCDSIKGGARHTSGQGALAKIGKALGMGVQVSVTIKEKKITMKKGVKKEEKAKRVEVQLVDVGRILNLDITVRDPGASIKERKRKQKDVSNELFEFDIQQCLRDAEEEKEGTYGKRSKKLGHEFYPMAISTWGGIAEKGVKLIDKLAVVLMMKDGVPTSKGEAFSRILLRLQVATMKKMAQNGLRAIEDMCLRNRERIKLD